MAQINLVSLWSNTGLASLGPPGALPGFQSHVNLVDLYDRPTVTPVAPTVANLVPSSGQPVTSGSPIQLDVTDVGTDPLKRVMLLARFATLGVLEVIHDGDAFGPSYQGPTNARSVIAGGYRYTLLRDGGWPDSLRLRVIAHSVAGAETA